MPRDRFGSYSMVATLPRDAVLVAPEIDLAISAACGTAAEQIVISPRVVASPEEPLALGQRLDADDRW